MARGEGYDFRPVLTHYLFLITFLLAFAGWFTAFIGQAAFTAQVGNPGTVWFAIFLELFLILGVLHTLATNSIPTHRLQISIFGAVAIVFSVQGANFGLFSLFSAAQATGAGWLILSFVNIIWVLYFTAEEDSTILHVMDSLGSGSGLSHARSGGGRSRRPPSHAQRGSNGYSGAGKEEHMGMSGMGGGAGMAPMHTNNTGMSMGMGGMGRPVSQENARSIGAGTGGGRSIGEDAHGPASPSTPLMSNAVPPGGGGAGMAPGAGGGAGAGDPEAGGYAYKAKALYAYTESPDDPAEISFAKGETLDIVDNNGKWWQARKENGTTGIVPSNYLQLM